MHFSCALNDFMLLLVKLTMSSWGVIYLCLQNERHQEAGSKRSGEMLPQCLQVPKKIRRPLAALSPNREDSDSESSRTCLSNLSPSHENSNVEESASSDTNFETIMVCSENWIFVIKSKAALKKRIPIKNILKVTVFDRASISIIIMLVKALLCFRD